MLINGSKLISCPILSLHIGGVIAHVTEPIINPDNLKIIGFKVEGKIIRENDANILPIESIREFSRMGMIVDSIDELVNATDVIKIKKALDIDFKLVGLRVVTRQNARIGKVSDYTVHIGDWSIQQLVVQRPVLKSFLDPELIIARNRIVEVDDERVVIKDERDKTKSRVSKVTAKPADFVPNFVNPFREPDFANEKEIKR